MSDIVLLNRAEARMLTEEVKSDAQAMWAKVLELRDRQAHFALGYSSWGAYFEAEFGQSRRTGYRLLEAARVVDDLPSDTRVTESKDGGPRVTQNVARELAKADDPAAAWETVVELNGNEPTAAQARDVVQQLKDPATGKQLSYLKSLANRAGAEIPEKPISKAKASRLIDHLRDGHACECRHCGRRMP